MKLFIRQPICLLLCVIAPTATFMRASGAAENAAQESTLLESEEAQITLIQNTFIAAPIAGVVDKVDAAEGDVVEPGAPLVRLNTDQAETELLAANSTYEAARLESANDVDERYARRTLEVRQRELMQSEQANRTFGGTVSETEIEKLKLVVDQSRLAIEQAEHKRLVATANAKEKQAAARITEARLNKHIISAAVAGVVAEIDVQPGEWVEPGMPVVRVISLDPLRAECFVDGRKYGSELVGHVVHFHPLVPNDATQDQKVFDDANVVSGQVVHVSQELNPVTGQVRLWATLPNPAGKIRAGMHGKLIVTSDRIKPAAAADKPVATPINAADPTAKPSSEPKHPA